MNVQRLNFHDLLNTYYQRTSAYQAAARLSGLIEEKRHGELQNLLRDHRVRGIYEKVEIDFRAGVDRLMNCYSAIEIATLSGFVADVEETDFSRAARDILENQYVRRYYEEFYPTRLPQVFRYRLAGRHARSEVTASVDVLAFLELDRRFMKELEDGIFLRMLDSFWIGGLGFKDVIAVIGNPKVFMEQLLLDPSEWGTMSKALRQFSVFMQFCFDLNALLSRMTLKPLIQSAIWNHYSYWFEIIGQSLQANLGKALAQFLQWKPEAGHDQAFKSIRSYLDDAQSVLTRLTSQLYLRPVTQLLRDAS